MRGYTQDFQPRRVRCGFFTWQYDQPNMILLMGPWNPANSPVEGQVVYPIIYRVLAPSQVVSQISAINSRSVDHVDMEEVLEMIPYKTCMAHRLRILGNLAIHAMVS